MKRIEYFKLLSELLEFKIIKDEYKNEFIVYKTSQINSVKNIADKTEFEALENHVHLLDNIKKDEFELLTNFAQNIGNVVLNSLKVCYPNKRFRVYISVHLHNSMIIRFHQVWQGEDPYYHPEDFHSPKEKVFLFEN